MAAGAQGHGPEPPDHRLVRAEDALLPRRQQRNQALPADRLRAQTFPRSRSGPRPGWPRASTEASGIWAPGGEAIDGSGNVYIATGNGVGPGSESVFKLSPSLGVLNQWRPINHQYLDDHDIDVGSISPALVGGGDVFQNGKFGQGFLR